MSIPNTTLVGLYPFTLDSVTTKIKLSIVTAALQLLAPILATNNHHVCTHSYCNSSIDRLFMSSC